MIMTAAVAFFAGAMIGLRFNVKMVAHASVLIVLVSIIMAATGLTFATTAALFGVIAIVSLQVGYAVTLILSAMGFMSVEAEDVADNRVGAEAPEIKPAIQPHTTR